jgi:diguanylate cyclase (GGDEF)-like protein
MKHKGRMSEALERKVSFRVAALDYLSDRNSLLRHVRLIAKPEFEGILSYVNIDEVTGVFNRRYFNEVLAQEFHRARRYESPLSLLILDIDEFKTINDTRGHLEGDAVLRKVGRLLRDNTRQPDSVCRYGGDEFAVLLPETSGAKAASLAERIRKAPERIRLTTAEAQGPHWPTLLRKEHHEPGEAREGESREPPGISLSIGGATYPADCDEAEELVALADQFCLDAKRRGKNRVVMGGDSRGVSLAAD